MERKSFFAPFTLLAGALLAFGMTTSLSAGQLAVKDFAAQKPAFDPVTFFTGHTKSWGVFEDQAGLPTQVVLTEAWGKTTGNTLRLEQDLYIQNKPKHHRVWIIRRIDAHHFESSADDIVGTTKGEAWGNAFSWTFVAILDPKNPLLNVKMTQHMYLQPGGKTMVNRDSIRKFGLVVAQVTEVFQKLK